MTKNFIYFLCAGLTSFALIRPAISQDFDVRVPMQAKNAATYYVNAEIEGVGNSEFMVDTGSGYMTINEDTLEALVASNQAEYLKDLSGILANGDRMRVPVYLISHMAIGGQCEIKDVEAAVFPGKTRQILGLSALSRTAPFIFSTDPAELVLTCGTGEKLAAADDPSS
jgi:predicted aspartyl protease